MWALPASGDGPASVVAGQLLASAGAGPVTIADGHHRYETALRYRDERRMTRSCEEDPPFDYVLALMLEATAQELTVLPTHRLVRGIGAREQRRSLARASELFEVDARRIGGRGSSKVLGGRRRRARWSGPVRAVDARRRCAPRRPTRCVRSDPARRGRGAPDRST